MTAGGPSARGVPAAARGGAGPVSESGCPGMRAAAALGRVSGPCRAARVLHGRAVLGEPVTEDAARDALEALLVAAADALEDLGGAPR